ncbi:MAG: hypothetical protein ACK50Q_15680 [Labrys sp. (in: a-proteobacteria)]
MEAIARFFGSTGQGCWWFALAGILLLQIPAIVWQFSTNGVLVGLFVMFAWPIAGTMTVFHLASVGAYDGMIGVSLWWIGALFCAGLGFFALALAFTK